jgi:hypothetical protein
MTPEQFTFVPPPQPTGAVGAGPRNIIVADEIRVGRITITSYGEDEAGIWIGNGQDRHMIAIFSTPTQVGVGVYEKGVKGPCGICLHLGADGAGMIQFADDDGRYVSLGLEDVRRLLEERTP